MNLAEFYEHHCAAKYAPIADLLGKHLPVGHGRALELAAGTGLLTRRVAQAGWDSYIVTDISPEMLRFAAAQVHKSAITPVEYIRADYAALPFRAASFDLVVANLALAHENQQAIAEIHRVLAPGGWWAASYWGTGSEAELIAAARAAVGLRPMPSISARKVHQYARQAGFACIEIQTVPVERNHADAAAFVAHRRVFPVYGTDGGQAETDAYFESLSQIAFREAPAGPLSLLWQIHLITAQAAPDYF
ncbi:MAG: class I SAM-dependent methyltransferase [Actinomycetota bacterium]|nr:class I SAM-dependent methyltransferase [Actinomycetota bacterium]